MIIQVRSWPNCTVSSRFLMAAFILTKINFVTLNVEVIVLNFCSWYVLSGYDVGCEILSCISRPLRFLETCHMFIQNAMFYVTLCNSRYVNGVNLDILDVFHCQEYGSRIVTYLRECTEIEVPGLWIRLLLLSCCVEKTLCVMLTSGVVDILGGVLRCFLSVWYWEGGLTVNLSLIWLFILVSR